MKTYIGFLILGLALGGLGAFLGELLGPDDGVAGTERLLAGTADVPAPLPVREFSMPERRVPRVWRGHTQQKAGDGARRSPGQPVASIELDRADAPEASEAVRRLQAENESLRSLHLELQDQLNALFAWMIDNYKGRFPLRENQITNLQFGVLSDTYELNPAVAEFMNLSDEQVETVSGLLQYGLDVVDDLIEDHMVVTDHGGGRVTVHIPPFPQEGALVREDMMFGLEATLGAGRLDRFLDVAGQKLEEEFHYFGRAAHTIMLEPTLADDGVSASWLLRDGWVIHESPTTTTIRATETIMQELPDWYYHVTAQ